MEANLNRQVKKENRLLPPTYPQLCSIAKLSKKLGEHIKVQELYGMNLNRQQASKMIETYVERIKKLGISDDKKLSKYVILKEEFTLKQLVTIVYTNGKFKYINERAMTQQQKRTYKRRTEVITHIIENMDRIVGKVKEALKIESVVVCDITKREVSPFVGFGCGFASIKYNRIHRIATEIYDYSRTIHNCKTFKMIFESKFPKEIVEHYEKIGCPLWALWNQDIEIQREYYSIVLEVMERYGVNDGYVQTMYD